MVREIRVMMPWRARQADVREARQGAEPGLAPRASGRKVRLGASNLTRTLCPAAPRRRLGGARAGATLQRVTVDLSEQAMA